MLDSRVASRRRYLVCDPRHFAVRYAINPWMRPDRPVDVLLAQRQWRTLVDTYRAHGHTVESVTPEPALPDMVFAANAAVVVEGRVFGSLFLAPERRPESVPYEAWFKAEGYEVQHPESVCEGEGTWCRPGAGSWQAPGSAPLPGRTARRRSTSGCR
ncbi:hypothetical protein SHKM778_59250 [Streptomyces sp. KM77-8]|uniref:Amidinotransferase n=1 Tax=Streptomyces haneummycinicus TaxID=3074435 RepID=A0AAT9HQB3_9ACTN